MGAVVGKGREAEGGCEHGDGGEAEDDERKDEQVEHGHLDVVGFDLFAEVLGGASDHEAGDEDGEDNKDEHAVHACADAAEDDLAEENIDERNHAAEGSEGIVHGVDGSAAGVSGDGGEEGGVGDAKADFFPFHVASGLGSGCGRGDMLLVDVVEEGIALGFGVVAGESSSEPENGHGGEDSPAVPRGASHLAKGDGERCGDEEDGKHLQEVGEGRGVLEGVGTVGVEEAAAISAEHLDGFLRGDGTLRDGLGGDVGGDGFAIGAGGGRLLCFDELYGVVGTEVLDDSLRDEGEGEEGGDGEEDPEDAAGHVGPEVSESLHLFPCDAADEGDGERETDGGRPEIMGCETEHLREIAHGGLGRVGLPVGVGGEGDSSVPGEVGRDAGEVLGVQGEMVLQTLDEVGEDEGDGAEQEHGDEVLGPAHLFFRVDAGGAIEQALDGEQYGVQEGAATLEDERHESAEGLRESEDQGEEDGDLQPAVKGH